MDVVLQDTVDSSTNNYVKPKKIGKKNPRYLLISPQQPSD